MQSIPLSPPLVHTQLLTAGTKFSRRTASKTGTRSDAYQNPPSSKRSPHQVRHPPLSGSPESRPSPREQSSRGEQRRKRTVDQTPTKTPHRASDPRTKCGTHPFRAPQSPAHPRGNKVPAENNAKDSSNPRRLPTDRTGQAIPAARQAPTPFGLPRVPPIPAGTKFPRRTTPKTAAISDAYQLTARGKRSPQPVRHPPLSGSPESRPSPREQSSRGEQRRKRTADQTLTKTPHRASDPRTKCGTHAFRAPQSPANPPTSHPSPRASPRTPR